MTEQEQKAFDAGMVEANHGAFAICVDEKARAYGWVMRKHPDGQWVTERRALPHEMQRAVQIHESKNTEPQRG